MSERWSDAGSRTRVLVVGGGQSYEHQVSLATAASVAASLDRQRYDVIELIISIDGGWQDTSGCSLPGGIVEVLTIIAEADVIFPAVHGPRGEDGTLAALCELAGRPYVGSGVRPGALAMDKWVTKLIAEELGLSTAPGVLMTPDSPMGLAAALSFPLVVKPVSGGSSFGVSRVDRYDDLAGAVRSALAIDERVLVEQLVAGREIDIAVLERADGSRLVGPPLEIAVGADAIFDTVSKYDGNADFRVPARGERARARRDDRCGAGTVRPRSAAPAWPASTSSSPTRRVVLNEINTMPGLTEQSQVPKIFAAVGISYADLIDILIEAALSRANRVIGRE